MAQWIRPWTLNREVPGSTLLAAAVVPLGKALYPHCLVPRKERRAVAQWARMKLNCAKSIVYVIIFENWGLKGYFNP